jgi:hypothetical protein
MLSSVILSRRQGMTDVKVSHTRQLGAPKVTFKIAVTGRLRPPEGETEVWWKHQWCPGVKPGNDQLYLIGSSLEVGLKPSQRLSEKNQSRSLGWYLISIRS